MKIISYNNFGEIAVLDEGLKPKVYRFRGISPYFLRRIEKMIRLNQCGRAWNILKKAERILENENNKYCDVH